jgi:hypothetical protein
LALSLVNRVSPENFGCERSAFFCSATGAIEPLLRAASTEKMQKVLHAVQTPCCGILAALRPYS